ncbi:hypothetical protein Acidovoranil_16100 [Acidovorax sp. FG27]
MTPAAVTPTSRRAWLRRVLSASAVAALPAWAQSTRPSTAAGPAQQAAAVEVWKDPNCGCCTEWVEHLRTAGFRVSVQGGGNAAVRQRLGLPAALGSCHTALVAGYLVEGHVPAADVRRLLREKPQALGLAVPGMPIGSPGMDGALYGGRRDAYDVLLVARDGSTSVFTHHPGGQAPAPARPDAAAQNPAPAGGAGDAALSEGEVVRWDAAARRLTLRHGELKNLAMAPMTMVFRVREATDGLKLAPGTRVRFLAEQDRSGLVARRIEVVGP